MSIRTPNNKGFTLIELLIATSIFTVILLLLTFGLMQIGRVYYKGINSSRAQAALRSISDDVVQSIQYSGKVIGTTVGTFSDGASQVCVGNKRYTYTIGSELGAPADVNTQTKERVLIAEKVSGPCTATVTSRDAIMNPINPLPSGAKELMGKGMRLLDFSVTDDTHPVNHTVIIKLGLGDSDLFTADGHWNDEALVKNALCKGGPGQQFCATAELESTVRKRLL